jgi:hypothetical protein
MVLLLLVFAFVGIVGTIYFAYEWRNHKDYEDKDYLQLALGSIVCSIFLLAGTIGSISEFISIYKFRNIDIATVKAFQIVQSKGEYKPDGKTIITFNDVAIIKEMLKSLQNCQSYSRNHESFEDGYKIKFVFTDEKLDGDFYLSVYTKSSANDVRAIVIPHYYKDKNLNLGEFICPEFQELVKNHIAPQFLVK